MHHAQVSKIHIHSSAQRYLQSSTNDFNDNEGDETTFRDTTYQSTTFLCLCSIALSSNGNRSRVVESFGSKGNILAQSIHTDSLNSSNSRALNDGSQKIVELLPSNPDRASINHSLLTLPQHLGCRSVSQTNLFIGPDRFDGFSVRQTNTSVTTDSLPVRSALDSEFSERLVDCINETNHLVEIVAGGNGEPEAFLTTGDGRIVDALDVYIVIPEESIGSCFSKSGVANKDGKNVGWAGDDRNIKSREPRLQFLDVHLLELPVSAICPLIGDTGTSASHVDGGKRCGENETRGIRTDHIDEVGRTSDVSANSTVSLTKGT